MRPGWRWRGASYASFRRSVSGRVLTGIASPVVSLFARRQPATPFFAGALIRSLGVAVAVDRCRIGAIAAVDPCGGFAIEPLGPQTIRAMLGVLIHLSEGHDRKEHQANGNQ